MSDQTLIKLPLELYKFWTDILQAIREIWIGNHSNQTPLGSVGECKDLIETTQNYGYSVRI